VLQIIIKSKSRQSAGFVFVQDRNRHEEFYTAAKDDASYPFSPSGTQAERGNDLRSARLSSAWVSNPADVLTVDLQIYGSETYGPLRVSPRSQTFGKR
jgi:hypothetical protein